MGACLLGLVLLAPFSLIASELPASWSWPFAVLAAGIGLRDWQRYRVQLPMQLLIPAGRGETSIDGAPVTGLRVAWRGPFCFMRWRDNIGKRQRLVFWPDTLAASARRELKLALQRRESANEATSVAP